MFKSKSFFPFLLFSFIVASAVFSFSLSDISKKRVVLTQKAVEMEITSNSSFIYPKAIITYQGKEIASNEIIKVKAGELITLDGSSSLGQFVKESYRWTFADKNISFSFGKTAKHTYNEEGTYEASLLVMNDSHDMDKTNIYVQVGSSAESQKMKYPIMENQQSAKIVNKFDEQSEEGKKILNDSQTIINEVLARKEKVAILVFNDTLNQLPGLRTYIDLVNEKFKNELEGQIKIYTEDQWYYKDPLYCQGTTNVEAGFRIRKLLKDLYTQEHITGAILFGKIPYLKWFEEREAIGDYGPHYYNIAPCNLCYEDLDAKFADEFKGAGPGASVFCGSGTITDPWKICKSVVPTPAPVQGDKCVNDGFNAQGDGILERYYPGSHEGAEIWVAWMRPLITGNGGSSNKILDNTGNLSELVQMDKLLTKAIDYLRLDGRLNTNRTGEVLFSQSYFNDGNDPVGTIEKDALEISQRFRAITSFIGTGYASSQQPNYDQVLAKDKEKYFLYFNRGYGYPEKIFHPLEVDTMLSEEIKNQPVRSLVTEIATCATANFLTAPSNNFAISSIVNNPMGQAVLALPSEVCWSSHVITDDSCHFIIYNGSDNFYNTWKDRFYGKAFALQERLFSVVGMRGRSQPITSIYNHMLFGNPFIWWWQKPTPTPTPTIACQRPFAPGIISGPAEEDKINYGDPELKIIDESLDVSCYPHDVVFSIWQGSTKKISSGFLENVLAFPGAEYSWRVNPLLGTNDFPPGTYEWRANLKNTAGQTVNPLNIPKINFTVCAKPARPKIAELIFGDKAYEGGTATVFKNDEIKLKVKDVSNLNSCYPHEVFLGIWPADATISLETAVKNSNWQVEIANQNGLFPSSDFWTFSTADLDPGNYKIAAIFKNNSADRNGDYGTPDSISSESQVVSFRLVDWHTACGTTSDNQYAVCQKLEGEGEKSCSSDSDCEFCDPSTCSGRCAPGRWCDSNPQFGGECMCW